LLVSKYGLKRITLPIGSDEHDINTPKSHIYVSENALTSEGTLLILLQGSGAVRPGQWSRSVIMNDSLEVRGKIQKTFLCTIVIFPSSTMLTSTYSAVGFNVSLH
jgi:hypothetical protein